MKAGITDQRNVLAETRAQQCTGSGRDGGPLRRDASTIIGLRSAVIVGSRSWVVVVPVDKSPFSTE
jgi:hypothetical protein